MKSRLYEIFRRCVIWGNEIGRYSPASYKLKIGTISIMRLLKPAFPRIVDAYGAEWLVDDHGILIEGRLVAPTSTIPAESQIEMAMQFFKANLDLVGKRKCKSTFRAKVLFEVSTKLYITNGAATVALARLGKRLRADGEYGSMRILQTRRASR